MADGHGSTVAAHAAIRAVITRLGLDPGPLPPISGAWRQDIPDAIRGIGLETRFARILPESVGDLRLPGVLVSGDGVWVAVVEPSDLPAPSWPGWEGAEALEIVGLAAPNGAGLVQRTLLVPDYRPSSA